MGNSFTSPGVSQPITSGFFAVSDARTVVRQFAQNASDSTAYGNDQIDRAIMAVGEDFVRITRCLPGQASVNLSQGVSGVDLSGIENFRPTRVTRIWIDTSNMPEPCSLSVVGAQAIVDKNNWNSTQNTPRYIAFNTWVSATVYPTPDQAYSLNVTWFQPFTVWTPGSDDTTVINLPAEWLRQVLATGVAAMLQMHENEHPYTGKAWEQYLQLRTEVKGMGSLGAKVVYRTSECPYPIDPSWDDPSSML